MPSSPPPRTATRRSRVSKGGLDVSVSGPVARKYRHLPTVVANLQPADVGRIFANAQDPVAFMPLWGLFVNEFCLGYCNNLPHKRSELATKGAAAVSHLLRGHHQPSTAAADQHSHSPPQPQQYPEQPRPAPDSPQQRRKYRKRAYSRTNPMAVDARLSPSCRRASPPSSTANPSATPSATGSPLPSQAAGASPHAKSPHQSKSPHQVKSPRRKRRRDAPTSAAAVTD